LGEVGFELGDGLGLGGLGHGGPGLVELVAGEAGHEDPAFFLVLVVKVCVKDQGDGDGSMVSDKVHCFDLSPEAEGITSFPDGVGAFVRESGKLCIMEGMSRRFLACGDARHLFFTQSRAFTA
jgi:hypothetical protein